MTSSSHAEALAVDGGVFEGARRMIERGEDLRLALEAGQAFRQGPRFLYSFEPSPQCDWW
jgi:hypothetical protein